MKRKLQVRGITIPHPPRRSKAGGSMPSICIACGDPIDLDAVNTHLAEQRTYVHICGRVLVGDYFHHDA